ncbi:Mrp/NBP35 family ATP-binding protein [Hyphomonas sp. WL0036]|uniref:Mrp/NBP35 family ATP-binding protein n=1 Tax=Hyphomonas sediminis TaxID=2866160 RepID=UPI001C808FBB|nr:Mrp/NBP35 family ATP-binding protein [Hyphomonas sediminis]MBY9065557.1 Mrp/NBP35 family ATP-binding protein [Hyphomonas sediminis]
MFGSKQKSREKLAAAVQKALGTPDWLESVTIGDDGRAILVIQAEGEDVAMAEARRMEAENAASRIAGITKVTTVLTAEKSVHSGHSHPHQGQNRDKEGQTGSPARQIETHPVPAGTRRVTKGARLSDEALSQGAPPPATPMRPLPGIARILVVASAKGGVGKSTVSVNLAAAMAKAGMKVGLLDADIYGPSIPTMLGTVNAEPATSPGKKLVPVEAHGMKTLSIGYLSDPDAPMIWRGPIVMSAITQLLNDAEWGTKEDPLDLLIIDTPPGTGDAQLAIAQKVPVTAAIIVTTPQEVALADVRRGAAMFAKTHVPVIGIAETMSWFEDANGNRQYLMGEGGGRKMAQALGIPLLAEIPMIQAIREGGDKGEPAALSKGPAADVFLKLARNVAVALDELVTKPAPEIVFED